MSRNHLQLRHALQHCRRACGTRFGTTRASLRSVHATHSAGGKGVSVFTVFTLLAAIGVGATAYGMYDFYSSFTIWPKELREHLRPAIKAQQLGELALSEKYLRRAWQTCQSLPKETLGVDPWLKISGIACKLGEVLEAADAPSKAYDVYAECCAILRAAAARHELSLAERHRAVALALHLGALAERLGKPTEEEEDWLRWSVEECMRMHKSDAEAAGTLRHRGVEPDTTELVLPTWTQNDAFEASLEALGSCYARQGNTEYALNLYLRAMSLILPPDAPHVRAAATPQRRCRAAQLMTNISSLLIRDSPSPERLTQAALWTSKGMEIAEKARAELAPPASGLWSTPKPEPECEQVWVALLYNTGAILEMQEDEKAAKEYYTRALVHAQGIGMREGVAEADDALARLAISRMGNKEGERVVSDGTGARR